jgi:hypothetical protein
MNKLIFIALNECNQELLIQASKTLPKGNYLSRLINLKLINLTTTDALESDFLEPWVQWVNIQTSTPSETHGIKHLGDITNLSQPQIWERLSGHRESSIVWGALNARRGKSEFCKVFVPDPFVFDEDPYPNELRLFTDFPRYIAKNYTSLSKLKLLRLLILFLKNYANTVNLTSLYEAGKILWRGLRKFGPQKFVFICSFDYLSMAAFTQFSRKKKVTLSYLFLNSIAHVQHHHWNGMDTKKLYEINFALEVIEKSLELLDKTLKVFSTGAHLAVCSGLGQQNTNLENPWVSYRIKNMASFLEKLSIPYSRVETLMSYDGHIIFNDDKELKYAFETLTAIHLDNSKLFLIEPDMNNCKLFFRINITRKINGQPLIISGCNKLYFATEMENLATRTGKHSPDSFVYHNIEGLEISNNKPIKNHLLFPLIFPEVFVNKSNL